MPPPEEFGGSHARRMAPLRVHVRQFGAEMYNLVEERLVVTPPLASRSRQRRACDKSAKGRVTNGKNGRAMDEQIWE